MNTITDRGQSVAAYYGSRVFVYLFAFTLLSGGSCYPCCGTPPPSTKNIPIYPGANTVISDTTEIGQSRPAQTINYQTNDKREAVISFYKDILLKDGWEIHSSSTPDPNGLYFGWTAGCPISTMDVIIQTAIEEQTKVEVVLKTYGCE